MRVNFWLLSLNNFTLRWTHISNRVVSTHIEFCLLSFSQEPTLPARTYPSKRSSQTYTSVAERFSMMQRHKKKSGGFRSGGYGGGMADPCVRRMVVESNTTWREMSRGGEFCEIVTTRIREYYGRGRGGGLKKNVKLSLIIIVHEISTRRFATTCDPTRVRLPFRSNSLCNIFAEQRASNRMKLLLCPLKQIVQNVHPVPCECCIIGSQWMAQKLY